MARKAKGSGFKMKSGNTTSFKEMGGSPVLQQADATLVAAAKAAAMANVPKDLSAQYNKTAEGAIAANKGKTDMLTTIAKEAPGIITAAGRGIDKTVGKIKSRYKAKKADKSFQDAKKGSKELKDALKRFKKGEKITTTNEEGVDVPMSKEDIKNMIKSEKEWKKTQRKRVRKTADEDFEKTYQKEHKDRTSIADIRKISGAGGESKEKPNYENLLNQLKYEREIEDNTPSENITG